MLDDDTAADDDDGDDDDDDGDDVYDDGCCHCDVMALPLPRRPCPSLGGLEHSRTRGSVAPVVQTCAR